MFFYIYIVNIFVAIDIIDCNFPADRGLEIRDTPEFREIAQRVRQGLHEGHETS